MICTINLRSSVLTESNWIPRTIYHSVPLEMSRINKMVVDLSRSLVLEPEDNWRGTVCVGYRVSFLGDAQNPELDSNDGCRVLWMSSVLHKNLF